MPPRVRRLLVCALLLTFCVVVFGAYVRLADAGLGCPDWPGCYGQLLGVADAQTAQARHPDSPYDAKKAWIETAHRYLAAVLGLLLAVACFLDWRGRERPRRFALPQWLLFAVVCQGLFGMLTVTQKLQPLVVVTHLLGGLLILFLLATAIVKPRTPPPFAPLARHRLRWLWNAAAVALVVQIALGGWVSANYAGLSCPDFPHCQGGWSPTVVDFSGYHPLRDLGRDADGGAITAAALATIHWLHRIGAVVLLGAAGFFAGALWQNGGRRDAVRLSLLLTAQIFLGVINVVWQLPLAAAAAHNAVAALLVADFAVLRVKLSALV